MDIKGGVPNAHAATANGGGVGGSRVSMYQVAPEADVLLEDFEQYALDRLRVLVAIEENRSRGKWADEVESAVMELWKKEMRTLDPERQQQKDVISHFVLRLVHCQREELRQWFSEMETALFRFRYQTESPESQKAFLEDQKFPYNILSATEFEAVKDKLAQAMGLSNHSASSTGQMSFYKVPFEEVLDAVATRKVYIQRGHAFVPRELLVTVVASHFRSMLSQALELTRRNWTAMFAVEEEDRLSPILEALSRRHLVPQHSCVSGSNVSLQELDGSAKQHFPLCMRHLYRRVREDHHLRHGGCQQLGLFLKGIGLTLSDALLFWRGVFAPRMPADKFDKQYAYNVRHNYGKEGRRTDYSPHSCRSIINLTPGIGDHHGCPYRHFSPENLHAALSGMRLNPNSIDAIMERTRNRQYQSACAATFESAHSCQCRVINHPIQYFEQSQMSWKQGREKETEMETDR